MTEEIKVAEVSTKAPKKTRKARTMTVQNSRGGKLIVNGQMLQKDETITLDAKYLADKKKMSIVNKSIGFGLLKKV